MTILLITIKMFDKNSSEGKFVCNISFETKPRTDFYFWLGGLNICVSVNTCWEEAQNLTCQDKHWDAKTKTDTFDSLWTVDADIQQGLGWDLSRSVEKMAKLSRPVKSNHRDS